MTISPDILSKIQADMQRTDTGIDVQSLSALAARLQISHADLATQLRTNEAIRGMLNVDSGFNNAQIDHLATELENLK